MAGVGNWQNLLPDEKARRLYAGIYPKGMPLVEIDASFLPLLTSWQRADIARIDDGRVVPCAPIITDEDLKKLEPWFQEMTLSMCAAVSERLPVYNRLAKTLSRRGTSPGHSLGNLLTILVCAKTLDLLAFALLRRELLGPHPPRGEFGRFFFWGYAFAGGPERILGVTTYRGRILQLSVIRSHGLDRGAIPALLRQGAVLRYLDSFLPGEKTYEGAGPPSPEVDGILSSLRGMGIVEDSVPPKLAVPVFTMSEMKVIDRLCHPVSSKVITAIAGTLSRLRRVIERCSFAQCSFPDVLCMLFHLAYSYAIDSLVEAGIVPEFPKKAGGEWGCWVHTISSNFA